MQNSDQLFLMKLHGAAAVGVYALAYRIVQGSEMFTVEPLCQVWQPWIYKAYQRPDGPLQMGAHGDADLGRVYVRGDRRHHV